MCDWLFEYFLRQFFFQGSTQVEESHHEIKIEIKVQLVAAIKTQTEFLWE